MASTAKRKDDMVEQFCSITGADSTVALSLLEACNDNLEMAINMHIESTESELGGGHQKHSSVASNNSSAAPSASSAAVNAEPDGEETVRAPIPPVQEVLVGPGQEIFAYGFRGKRRTVRSVFDGFRDFQVETRRQEELLGVVDGASSSVPSRKRKTLEDLFRPPLDMIFRGSFQSARDKGVSLKKWLLVNVQNVQEFACQVLNRDVWSNTSVKNIVQEHFIFWQVYMDSSDGQRYMAFYKVTQWPYVAILDPQTGESLRVWHRLDAVSFCDLATEFLSEHPSMDGIRSPARPQRPSSAAVGATAESILDASEDSQLEAAIRESLKGKGTDSGAVSEQDGSDLETFESEGEEDRGKEESKDGEEWFKRKRARVAEEKETLPQDDPKLEPKVAGSWMDYLGSESDPPCTLMLRFPDSCKEHVRLPSTSQLAAVSKYVEEKGFPPDSYELVTNFPRRQLSNLSSSSTLTEAGLGTQETIFVQPR